MWNVEWRPSLGRWRPHSTFNVHHSTFPAAGRGTPLKKLPWYLRDLLWVAIFVAVLIGAAYGLDAIPLGGMAYYKRVLVLMGINITLAVSLNIINGHAGQFSLGHAGFMAVGAYFAAFLTVYYFSPIVDKMPAGSQQWIAQNAFVLIAILLGGAAAAVAGYIVG